MIDAVDLPLAQHLLDVGIQFPSGLQVVAKGLFEDDAPPAAAFLAGQTRLPKLADDFAKEGRGRGQIVEVIVLDVVVAPHLGAQFPQAHIKFRIAHVTGDIVDPLLEPLQHAGIQFVRGITPNGLQHAVAKGIRPQ